VYAVDIIKNFFLQYFHLLFGFHLKISFTMIGKVHVAEILGGYLHGDVVWTGLTKWRWGENGDESNVEGVRTCCSLEERRRLNSHS